MEKVGVRDLKTHASEIVRRVREDRETIELTYRGETIAKIVPIVPRPDPEAIEHSLAEWQRIIASIAAHRIDDVSAEETMREIRRDLSDPGYWARNAAYLDNDRQGDSTRAVETVRAPGSSAENVEPDAQADAETHREYWKWHQELAEEITKHWEGDTDSLAAVREQRGTYDRHRRECMD